MHVQTATDWRKDNGFTHPYTFHPVAAEYLLTSDRLETKLVYDGEEDELVRLRFPSGRQLVGHWGTSLPPGEFRLYAKGPDSEPTPHDIQTTFWSCGESIKMVSGHDGVALEAYSPWDESSYEGPDYELIERWERFLEEGINRSVYLYGEGHGEKLDFCDKAARELGRRIIRLDGGQIEVNELPAWRRVLELISPDVVIVEEATGFLYFRPGTVTYRNTQAFFTQCHESPLTLLCGEEREDGCRLRLRPDVIDEFQKFQGEHSQTEEEQERAPTVREACEWQGWDGFDDLESEFELWRNHDAIRLNAAGGRLVAKSLDLDDVRYRGPHLPLRQAVSEYTSNDMSQQILLRAPVGTGKTTLAFDIARHASDKIIVMDPRATLTMGFGRWKKMTHGREPEVVIFTDVPADPDSTLGQNLRTLQRADLPTTLYLTEDVDDWTFEAEEAYGFDQIIDMELPSEKDRRRVMEGFADEFETSIPDDQYEFLDELYCESTPRRVREVIRRARQVGWSRTMEPHRVG